MRHFILEQLLEYSEQAISNLALQWNFIEEFINQFLRVIRLESAVDKKVEYHNDTGIKGHFEGYCQKKILPTLLLV